MSKRKKLDPAKATARTRHVSVSRDMAVRVIEDDDGDVVVEFVGNEASCLPCMNVTEARDLAAALNGIAAEIEANRAIARQS